jgi:tRNA(Ile)-lysidine synthase
MWSDLEHSVWQELKKLDLKSRNLLLCCSGGADSVALFWVLKKLKLKFSVIHFHHGALADKVQNQFRDQACLFVQNLCESENVKYEIHKSAKGLTREAECRDFRASILVNRAKSSWVLMAHHLDDLLETRLMRLIRGTGPWGLKSMQIKKGVLIRPFLQISAQVLRNYLLKMHKNWLEDPSNQDPRYLRNWLRNEWIPALEARQQGAVNRLSLSLESLSQKKSLGSMANILRDRVIKTDNYWTFSENEQIQALALLLKSNSVTSFGLSQIKEAQRQILQQKSREFSFKIAHIHWHINAQQIRLQL